MAVVEIVSPGNKSSAHAVSRFAGKAARFLRSGIHLLIGDLFPPTRRDPHGLHKRIWDRIEEQRPLETTYMASWEDFPQALKGSLEATPESGGV